MKLIAQCQGLNRLTTANTITTLSAHDLNLLEAGMNTFMILTIALLVLMANVASVCIMWVRQEKTDSNLEKFIGVQREFNDAVLENLQNAAKG